MKVMQAREGAETILGVDIPNTGKKVLVTGSKRKLLCFILQIIYEICYQEAK